MREYFESDDERHALRVIIPAKNEAERIHTTLVEFCEHFRDIASILVVANGCTDGTITIVDSLRRKYGNLSMLVVEAGIGKGGAVRAGLTIGNEPYIAIADADGSTSAEEIGRLFRHCRSVRAAGVIGSRWLRGATIARKQTFKRRVASRTFNAIVRCMFGLGYSDTQCGAKVFARDAIDRVLERLEIANFAFDVDLLLALNKLGSHVVEIPIAWSDVPENSQVHLLRNGSSMFWALVRLWVRHSPLRNLPFLDMLARSSVIPVRSGLNVLVIRSSGSTPALDRVVLAFSRQGHETTIVDVHGIPSLVRFAWWYLSYGHRRYDIIVDATKAPLSNLIALSAKPKITATSMSMSEPNDMIGLAEHAANRCGYSALLWRDENGWKLSSAPFRSMLLEPV